MHTLLTFADPLPLWALVMAALLPLVPFFARELAWIYRRDRATALFSLLVAAQSAHAVDQLARLISAEDVRPTLGINLTGSFVRSMDPLKPIGVFGGHEAVVVEQTPAPNPSLPNGPCCADHVEDMMFPDRKLSAFLTIVPTAQTPKTGPGGTGSGSGSNPDNPGGGGGGEEGGDDGSGTALGGCSTTSTSGGALSFLLVGLAALIRRRRR